MNWQIFFQSHAADSTATELSQLRARIIEIEHDMMRRLHDAELVNADKLCRMKQSYIEMQQRLRDSDANIDRMQTRIDQMNENENRARQKQSELEFVCA